MLMIDEHLLNFTGPCTGNYAVLPDDLYRKCELRVSNAAQFFSSAIVPFILEDTMQFVVSLQSTLLDVGRSGTDG
jgi:hypothetical protein